MYMYCTVSMYVCFLRAVFPVQRPWYVCTVFEYVFWAALPGQGAWYVLWFLGLSFFSMDPGLYMCVYVFRAVFFMCNYLFYSSQLLKIISFIFPLLLKRSFLKR
jgi:hypothetical protein